MNKDDCILISGGAQGAEAEFGRNAERHGIEEINFSFEGHNNVRRRGLRVLTHEELKQGDVSFAYLSKLMNRRYTESPTFRKILQSIWHQVNKGEQIFVVGRILDDGTVKGGTGWGAEFAKLCNKPLYVYDQQKRAWFAWDERRWVEQSDNPPRISAIHFTGTGTRSLEESGKQAIAELYDRSFS